MRRVGHKGADLIAPGNTAASFQAALDAGVDMIEFDVLSEHRDGTGELYLAHDYRALESGERLTLAEGLALFAGEAYAGIELDVDLKLPGYEERVLAALREAGAVELVEHGVLPLNFACPNLIRRGPDGVVGISDAMTPWSAAVAAG